MSPKVSHVEWEWLEWWLLGEHSYNPNYTTAEKVWFTGTAADPRLSIDPVEL